MTPTSLARDPMFPNDERRPMSETGKTLFAAFTQINARPLTDWQRDLERNEASIRALLTERHRLLGRPVTANALMQMATWARRACELLEPDRRIEAADEAAIEMLIWIDQQPQPPSLEDAIRESIARYEALLCAPVRTEAIFVEQCHACDHGEVELSADDSIACNSCGRSYNHIPAVREKAERVRR